MINLPLKSVLSRTTTDSLVNICSQNAELCVAGKQSGSNTGNAAQQPQVVNVVFLHRLKFPRQREGDRDWLVKLATARLDRYDWSDVHGGIEDFHYKLSGQRVCLDTQTHHYH